MLLAIVHLRSAAAWIVWLFGSPGAEG